MIKSDDFTNKELLNVLVSWIRNSNAKYSSPLAIASDIENGTWLIAINEKLESEIPHSNC